MSLKQKVTEYLELRDGPGVSSRQLDEAIEALAEEVGYETPTLSQKDLAEQGTYVDVEKSE